MTVANQTNRTSAVGSGAIGQEVPFRFPITATSDLLVKKRITATGVPTDLAETTNYTVSISGDIGGTLTTVTAIEITEQIHIIRNTPMTQLLDLEQGGSFNAEHVEGMGDKNTKLSIENADAFERTLVFPATDPTSSFADMPNSIDRASKNLTFDSDGKPTASVVVEEGDVTFTDFGTDMAEAANAASARTLLDLGWIDVRAYGAVGDGVTDDTAAIVAAMTAASVGDIIIFPAGTYNFTDISITKSLVLKGIGTIHRWMIDTSVTILNYTGAANAITISNAAATNLGGITLENLELKPAVGGAGVHGIYLSNSGAGTVHNIQFRDIMVKSFGGSGIYSTGTVFDVTLDRVNTRGNVGDGIKVVAGGGAPGQWRFNNCFLDSETGVWAANLYNLGAYFIGGTIASWDGHGVWLQGFGSLLGMNIEGVSVADTVGVKYSGSSGCTISGCKISLWDIGIECDGRAMTLSALDNNNVTYDLKITDGGSRQFCVILNKAYDAVNAWRILNNRLTVDGVQDLVIPCQRLYAIAALADEATPSVSDQTLFLTGGITTITDFDDGLAGQIITIIAEHKTPITDGTNIFLRDSCNWTMQSGDNLTLVQKADTFWYEVGRSHNTSSSLAQTVCNDNQVVCNDNQVVVN